MISTIQRKMTLLCGAVALTMAMIAAPASADNTDFPHEMSADKWGQVETYDYNGNLKYTVPCSGVNCAFHDTAKVAGWFTVFGFKTAIGGESCDLKGSITSKFGDVDFDGSACVPLNRATGAGEICRHKYTGEMWVRISLEKAEFEKEENEIFAHLLLDPSGLQGGSVPTYFPQGIVLGDPDDNVFTSFNYTSSGGVYSQGYVNGDFDEAWDETQVLIGQATSDSGCGWPELS